MPGAYLWLWYPAGNKWVKGQGDVDGKIVIDPTEILEDTPYGLSFRGTVTTVDDSTHFKVLSLASRGTGFFKPIAGAPYEIYVVQADGAAPEGEQTPVVAYTSSDGTFQHATFTANLAVGDKVLILHPLIASLGTKATAAAEGAVTTTDYMAAYIKQTVNLLLGLGTLADELQELLLDEDYGLEAAWALLDNWATELEALLGTKASPAATGAVSDAKDMVSYLKQIVTGLALDGTAPHSYDYTKATVPGWLHGFHFVRRILFVIPEAVGSITTHNTAIKAVLDKAGIVFTITQADAPTYPDYESITLVVLGSPLAGTAWNTDNLEHIKAVFGLPILCVDALAAVYLKMGTDGDNAASKTVLNATARIEGSILGMGVDDTTGLAAGANTVAASGVTFSTLNMSNAKITKIWYAWESTEADTDVLIGQIRQVMPDGTTGIDLDGNEVPGTLTFYGCAYSMGDLNTLGQAVFHLLVEQLLHSSTAGLAVLLSGNVGNLVNTIGTKKTAAATDGVTNAKKMMAYVKQLVTLLIAQDVVIDNIHDTDLPAVKTDTGNIKTQTDKLAGASPSVGTATENWNAAEANIVSIGANDTKNKLHSLVLDISGLTATATITIRMYMQVNGVEKKVYDQDFVVGTDPDGLWIVNGTVGIHEVLRVTAESDDATDDGLTIAYDYMLEVM